MVSLNSHKLVALKFFGVYEVRTTQPQEAIQSLMMVADLFHLFGQLVNDFSQVIYQNCNLILVLYYVSLILKQRTSSSVVAGIAKG